ncbi:hypothetical protein ACFVW8_35735 [Streptomyces sp. NPDC058221]|uniref:MmyB family transcriptional regulator n=1 Tax=Streptomyces sp. NPDC058221 TaxID=3346388 RepID=UPI0036EC7AC2
MCGIPAHPCGCRERSWIPVVGVGSGPASRLRVEVSADVHRLLDGWGDYPAYVRDRCFDVLAANWLYEAMRFVAPIGAGEAGGLPRAALWGRW